MNSLHPRLFALFQKRFDGDDALLELARLRFLQAGLGMEIYADTVEEAERLLGFAPDTDTSALLHLPRELDLTQSRDRDRLRHLIPTFGKRFSGYVAHDRPEYAEPDTYRNAVSEINDLLLTTAGRLFLFVEYAAGLDFDRYGAIIEAGREYEQVSACLDIGHLGIRQARKAYAEKHPGEDICALSPADPKLPEFLDDVQDAVSTVPNGVAEVVRRLAKLGKPLHFHLHDGHPLSTISPFGVSDHLSFFETVPLPFTYKGKRALPPMFGPAGLRRIVDAACTALPAALLSFTLEIHPAQRREPLADAAHLFNHWTDLTNAEKMNGWLLTLLDNHRLLLALLQGKTGPPASIE